MEPPKHYRSWLTGLSLGVAVAMLVWPATRSVMLHNVHTELLQDTLHGNTDLARTVAERHPQDVQMQIAYAASLPITNGGIEPQSSAQRIAHFKPVIERFPESPSVYANEMRLLTLGAVQIRRPEEDLFTGETPPKQFFSPPNEDAKLAKFDADAAIGEKLEPDNAYFPMMRAIGLFESHRDAKALAAMRRAGEKSRWEDYAWDEPAGQMSLQTEMYGERSAIERTAIYAALLLPHYAGLRAAARQTMYFATEAEKQGRTEEGLQLRRAVVQCGSLMRVQSRCAIGTLVGIAITNIGAARPGGIPPVKQPATLSESEMQQRRQRFLQAYSDYLTRIGHPEEVRWVRAEFDAEERAKKIIRSANDKVWGPSSFLRLGIWTAAAVLLLSNVLAVLCFGGFAALAPLIKPRRGIQVLRLVSILLLCGTLVTWQQQVIKLTTGIFPDLFYSEGSDKRSIWDTLEQLALLGSLLVPFLTSLVLLGCSRVWRVPITTGLGRGWRGLVAPIISVLVLLYAVAVIGLTRQEIRINAGMDRMIQSESQYYAELAGETWPGPTPH